MCKSFSSEVRGVLVSLSHVYLSVWISAAVEEIQVTNSIPSNMQYNLISQGPGASTPSLGLPTTNPPVVCS